MVNIRHGQMSKRAYLTGQFLLLLLFLSYISDLPDDLNSIVKLFADDTSLFSVVHSIYKSTNLLHSNLSKIKRMGSTMENEF